MPIQLPITNDTLGTVVNEFKNNSLLQFINVEYQTGNLIFTLFNGSTIVIPLPVSSTGFVNLTQSGNVLLGSTSGLYNQVTVSPIEYLYNGVQYSINTTTTINLSNGDLTNDRIDILYIDSADNTIKKLDGTPGNPPMFPTISSDKLLVGAIYVKANADNTTPNFYNLIYTIFNSQQISNQINMGPVVSKLVELTDVNITTPLDGQILTYDALSTKYILTNPIVQVSQTTAGSGLTQDNGVINLGGTLTDNTNIDISNFDFQISNGTNSLVNFTNGVINDLSGISSIEYDNRILNDSSEIISIDYDSRYLKNSIGEITYDYETSTMYDGNGNISINNTDRKFYSSDGVDIITWDSSTSGLQYTANAGTDFNDLSIPNVQYLKYLISIIPSSPAVNNGLTLDGGIVQLGGTLIESTVIDIDGNSFLFNNGSNGIIDFTNRLLKNSSNIITIDWELSYLKDIIGNISLDWENRKLLDTTGSNIVDWSSSTSGLVMQNDLSNTFINESLITKRYVDNLISSNDFFGTNGLTNLNYNAIGLGGTLTQTTNINIDSNSFTVGNGTNSIVDFTNSKLIDLSDRLSVNWDTRRLLDNAGNIVLDWQGRYLANGSVALLDWNTGILRTPSNAQTLNWFQGEVYDGGSALSLKWNNRTLADMSGATLVDWNSATSGLVMSNDLSSTFINESIVTKRYVDNQILNSSNSLITLTGDITGSGTSGIVTTLATVNSNVGTFGTNIIIPQFTVNGKGLISSVSNLSIPTSSSSTSGLLSSTDWTTFNNKQNALTNPITGSGTSGQVSYFNGATTQTSSSAFVWDTTNNFLGIGGTPLSKLYVSGNISSSAWGSNGISLRIADTSYTDTTSTGAVTTAYINSIGSSTINTTLATTFNTVANVFINAPIAGSNGTGGLVTITNPYALVLGGSLRLNGSTPTINSSTNLNIQSGSTSNSITFQQGGNTRYMITTTGLHNWAGTVQSSGTTAFWSVVQPAFTGGSFPGLLWTAGAHNTQTASTELTDINFALARNITFSTGALTTQRAFRIQAPTYAFVGSSTVTTAVTLDVETPIAGTNATITNNYAIRANGNINLSTAGNKLIIAEGSNGAIGQTTLVAGTKAITISGLTSSSRAFGVLVSQGGTVSTTVGYEYVCTTNTLTINAVTNAGSNALNILDTSVLNYIIYN